MLKQLDDMYPGRRHVLVDDLGFIRRCRESKTSACWSCGTVLGEEYVELAFDYDPGDRTTVVFVAQTSVYQQA